MGASIVGRSDDTEFLFAKLPEKRGTSTSKRQYKQKEAYQCWPEMRIDERYVVVRGNRHKKHQVVLETDMRLGILTLSEVSKLSCCPL